MTQKRDHHMKNAWRKMADVFRRPRSNHRQRGDWREERELSRSDEQKHLGKTGKTTRLSPKSFPSHEVVKPTPEQLEEARWLTPEVLTPIPPGPVVPPVKKEKEDQS